MQNMIRRATGLACMLTLLTLPAWAETQTAGYVDFGKIPPPGEGGEFVEVTLKANLINMIVKVAKGTEPEVAEMIKGIQNIRVNVLGMDDKNRAEVVERIKALRSELEAKGWERIVTVQQKDEDVGVYVRTRGEEAIEGIVVTVLDHNKEAVLVNVVGDIKPEKLAELGQRLNIEPLKKVGESLKKS